jgi:hypothetical protein
MSRDPRPRRRGFLILAGAGIALIPLLAAAPAQALILPLPSLPLVSALPTVRPLSTIALLPTISPLPTIGPLPSPLPTIGPLPSPLPSVSPTLLPTALPTFDPRPTAPPTPGPSDSPTGPSDPRTGVLEPRAASTPASPPAPLGGAGSTFDSSGSTSAGGSSDLGTLGAIVVPALIVGVPSLLVLWIVLAQLFGAAFWIPVVRRMLGPLGLRSRRPHD